MNLVPQNESEANPAATAQRGQRPLLTLNGQPTMKSFSAVALDVEALPEDQRLRILASLYIRAFFTKRTAFAFLGCLMLLLLGDVLEEKFDAMSGGIEVVTRVIGFSTIGISIVTRFVDLLSAGPKKEESLTRSHRQLPSFALPCLMDDVAKQNTGDPYR